MFESFMNSPIRSMTLTGKGQVTAVPDMAVIRLGVESTGSDLSSVQQRNAMVSQAVLSALHRLGISDVKTFQYTVDKFYEYDNGTPVFRGYTVRNILELRTDQMKQLGGIVDTAVNAGANVVDLISFEVADPGRYYRQALNQAVSDAIEKAKSISRGLGVPIEPIPVSITETSTMSRPPQPFQREIAATPIVPGTLTIEAGISAEFLY